MYFFLHQDIEPEISFLPTQIIKNSIFARGDLLRLHRNPVSPLHMAAIIPNKLMEDLSFSVSLIIRTKYTLGTGGLSITKALQTLTFSPITEASIKGRFMQSN